MRIFTLENIIRIDDDDSQELVEPFESKIVVVSIRNSGNSSNKNNNNQNRRPNRLVLKQKFRHLRPVAKGPIHPSPNRKRKQKKTFVRFMSASESPLFPQPSAAPQVGLDLLRPSSLELDHSGVYQNKMGYHTGLIVGKGCCPPGVGVGAHLSRQDVMTYSQYVHGSIFSVPKSWQLDHGENLVVSVYTFLKTFLG